MDAVRTQWERSRNVVQTFPSIPGLYYVNEDHIKFVLRWYYVNAVVSTTLLSPYCVLVRSRPHDDFFEHVQNSPTSTKTIKIAPRPYRFLLRSFYVVQVRTASKRFYIDVVGTWSSVTGVYDFFEHVQNLPTSTKTIKIAPRPYRFLLRSFYVVQVRTASKRFYIDVVGTWSSVTGV